MIATDKVAAMIINYFCFTEGDDWLVCDSGVSFGTLVACLLRMTHSLGFCLPDHSHSPGASRSHLSVVHVGV